MRPFKIALAGLLLAGLAAAPVAAAETWHYRNAGSSAFAAFTNLEGFDWENPQPGSYFETYVDAGTSVSTGSDTYESSGVCVWHWAFTVDAEGNFTDETSLGACVDGASFTLDRRLNTATIDASIPVVECTEWGVLATSGAVVAHDTGEECIGEWIELGTIEVDLTLTGFGPVYRYHDAGSGGAAGVYQYTNHGTGSAREADPTGNVTFDGVSLIEGATYASAELWMSKSGYIEISH